MSDNKFYGFYRGIVKANDDSSEKYPFRCRVKVYVPQVYGDELQIPDELPWAEPCVSMFGGGRNDGQSHGFIAIPPIDSSVWVGFEQGDPVSPIWFGSWFGIRDSDGVSELGAESRDDPRSGLKYPQIAVMKAPWKGRELHEDEADVNGMYIRFVGGNRIEIVFHEGNNYIELDGIAKKVVVNTVGWDVDVRSRTLNKGTEEAPIAQGGGINLIAYPFTNKPEDEDEEPIIVGGEVTIQGHKVRIISQEDLSIRAEGKLSVHGEGITKLSSSNVIYGAAPHSSGFDMH